MAYEFHYTPTGTGVISGKEVLEQTEDAINDLSGQISGDVQIAIDTANNALNTANTASADAQNAINTANTAYTAATNAQNTANAAQTTATNAQNAATAAQNDVDALENVVTGIEGRLTTTEGNVTNLTTRMGTAEGNIGNLQTAVSTAQATANSAQQTATTARQQSYVTRYTATSVSDNSTVAYSDLNNTDNIKIGDFILDVNGKLYAITAVDTSNETVSVTTPLTRLAVDSLVVHNSGNETVGGNKTFTYPIAITAFPSIRMYLTDDDSGVLPQTNKQTEIRFTDKNSVLVSYFAFQHRTDSNEPFRTCWRQQKMDGTSGYYSIDFNNLGDFYPENTNVISLGRERNRWKDVNTYLVNGINPGALFLPANRDLRVNIAAYFTNMGNGDENTYTALADGYIFLDVTSINKIILFSQTASQQINYAQTVYGGSDGRIFSFFPVRKDDLFKSMWYTASAANVTSAFFIPCKGNV